MNSTADLETKYWNKQIEIYNKLPYEKSIRYYSWQPARFAANRAAVTMVFNVINEISSICELGAGSAAFSIEMYNQNHKLNLTAIDINKAACLFGEILSHDLNVPINYINKDIFDLNDDKKFDFVLSLGVIEHFSDKQADLFIEKCKSISNKYVFIAIPNQKSITFKSYVTWSNFNNNQYGEDHNEFTCEMLLSKLVQHGLKPLLIDGFQAFLSEKKFLLDEYLKQINYIKFIKKTLVKQDRKFENTFPNYNFKYEDIDLMSKAELNMTKQQRLDYCFMSYVLCEKID